MERAAYILTVRPGMEQAYREAHKAVWPELIAEASKAGVLNHSVFMRDRTLIVYLEAENIAETTRRLSENAVNRRWDEYMADFLEPGETLYDEVFHMD